MLAIESAVMNTFLRRSLPLFTVLIACAGIAGSASANVSVSGGSITIAVEPSFTDKLASRSVSTRLVTPASGTTTQFTLPIRDGLVVQSTGFGSYRSVGGLGLKGKSKQVNIANMRFLKGRANLMTATVGGQAMTAFAASPGTVVRNGFNTDVRSVVLRLTTPAAQRINSVLGLKKSKALKGEQLVGVATINSIACKIEVAGGGRFRTQLDTTTTTKLSSLGISLKPLKPGKTSEGKFIFPGLGGGYLKPSNYTGEIFFGGGFSFKRGKASLKLRNPIVTTSGRPAVTLTRSNGKKIRFALITSSLIKTQVDLATRRITLADLHLTLTLDGSRLLKSVFKTTTIAQNDPIGVSTVEIRGK